MMYREHTLTKPGEPMSYNPRPIDTSGVALPKELAKLTELLAENSHDLWARQRIRDGWTRGRRRDDSNKRHPDLVPYADLPDSEKQYDRISAIETLKGIMALGYRIEAPSKATAHSYRSACQLVDGSVRQLKSPDKLDLVDLRTLWDSLSPIQHPPSPEMYELLGSRILKIGEPLLAYDVIARGLASFPAHVRLRQLLALALARSGAPDRANVILRQLRLEGHTDGETLGILARTHKDLWELATDPATRTNHLRHAHEIYRTAYRLAMKRGAIDDSIYTGINAATTALLLRRRGLSRSLARAVRVHCMDRKRKGDDYWAEATLGEAAVVLSNYAEAEDRYSRATELAAGNYGDMSTTRRQARHLLWCLGQDMHRFDPCFAIPKIIIFAGHMIDQPTRPRSRFPQELAHIVRHELARRLKTYDEKIGYSGAACGSDILFLEEMQSQNAETHVVLPFPEGEFLRTSVDIIPGGNWGRRLQKVLKQAAAVRIASEHRFSDSTVGYQYSNLLQDGLGRLRAQMLDTELITVAVWDGGPGDGPGGTAWFVRHWRRRGSEPDIVDMAAILKAHLTDRRAPRVRPQRAPTGPHIKTPPRGFSQRIMAVLFADVPGYSELSEERVPSFVRCFMGALGALIDQSPHKPVARHTWGDAVYLVLPSVRDAGNLALEMLEMVHSIDWKKEGLPGNLSLRVGLHAGPVYSCIDPVVKGRVYTGAHVTWAARIEPIAPPGLAYASEPFAALAEAEGVTDFICEYVGQTALAKTYGTFPTYHVRRSSAH